MPGKNYVAIEGVIGVGKTTLLHKIAKGLSGVSIGGSFTQDEIVQAIRDSITC